MRSSNVLKSHGRITGYSKTVVCLVYIDEIIIFSKTLMGHLPQIEEVFNLLNKAEMMVKLTKCFMVSKAID